MKTNPHSLKLIQEAIRNDPNGLTLEPWGILDMIEDLLEFHENKEGASMNERKNREVFDWKLWFENAREFEKANDMGDYCEQTYQAFKHRLMRECSVVERMTPEEYEELKRTMVVEK